MLQKHTKAEFTKLFANFANKREMAPLEAMALSCQLAISFFSSLVVPNGDPNVVCSPLSISSALALVAAGSRGKTLREIAKTIGWKKDEDGLGLAGGLLTEAKKAMSSCDATCPVKSANNVWVEDEFKLLDSYLDFLKSFGVQVKAADFKGNSSQATSSINNWVQQQTNDKIRDLFSPGQINQDTRAVLVNALYFKGDWAVPFDESFTQDSEFHVSNDKQVQVKMMYRSGEYKYSRKENYDLIELPYSSKSFSMVLVVPDDIDGLDKLQSKLTPSLVSDWVKGVQSETPMEVDVFLPKFKISHKADLKQHLESLGMKTMFSQSADFSGMTGVPNLYVSNAVHQAVIEVNEKGTVAAGATGIGMAFMSLPPQVRADKPFLFMIIANDPKSILFIGKVGNPSI